LRSTGHFAASGFAPGGFCILACFMLAAQCDNQNATRLLTRW
jgi:hypothetical protein